MTTTEDDNNDDDDDDNDDDDGDGDVGSWPMLARLEWKFAPLEMKMKIFGSREDLFPVLGKKFPFLSIHLFLSWKNSREVGLDEITITTILS